MTGCPEARKTKGESAMANGCDSCEMVSINGMACHETGCPDAWRDKVVECRWCGTMFVPEYRHQTTCSRDCFEAWNG